MSDFVASGSDSVTEPPSALPSKERVMALPAEIFVAKTYKRVTKSNPKSSRNSGGNKLIFPPVLELEASNPFSCLANNDQTNLEPTNLSSVETVNPVEFPEDEPGVRSIESIGIGPTIMSHLEQSQVILPQLTKPPDLSAPLSGTICQVNINPLGSLSAISESILPSTTAS